MGPNPSPPPQTGDLAQALEAERHRIALDLHDGPCQLLATAKYRLNDVISRLEATHPALAQDTSAVRAFVNQAMAELREISDHLFPRLLDEHGLEHALRQLARDFSDHHKVRVETHLVSRGGELPRDVQYAVYRIVQEAFNNVSKHARASVVQLFLRHSHRGLWLTVQDNGAGFDPARAVPGAGLANMRERANWLRGSLHCRSAPGHGTSVYAHLPLSEG
jgi:signal transduction histidine kinase